MNAVASLEAPPVLSHAELASILDEAVEQIKPDGRRIVLLVPDGTRSCPLDLVFRELHKRLMGRARCLTVLFALGTHPPMSREAMLKRLGLTEAEAAGEFRRVALLNHAWDDPNALVTVGRLDEATIASATEGRFNMAVDVQVNRAVLQHDLVLVVGPVFPHEVVGFSGGNKYLFPGISGPAFLHFFHWLGAVITNRRIIGVMDTPVRRVLDRAAALLPVERRALCMVVDKHSGGLAGLFFGTPEDAWRRAAELSAQIHVRRMPRAFHTVLSCAPEMYDELWVGGKCMYKLEPVVERGGELIIYAPHIREISAVHGALIRQIGYHVRDYFLAQWDRFKHHPWGILAHSTHVKGDGEYVDGVERPYVNVVLATGIPEEECRQINLGYRDPASIRFEEFMDREDDGVLYVPNAGEILYRLRDE
ncbi:MAG: lactate racemase domain-containing protein [Kiritimatiellae bacterium]|nr:lactate racemase domain-containing protein [Kiritimatiellia bacterium]MDW8459378.1 lactate racemase domain-containing protein [Verrucomicrobiota bacterium]